MLYPRRTTTVGFITGRFIGGAPTSWDQTPIQRRGMFTAFRKTSAVPDGYSAGGAFVLPYVAGGLSSWQSSFGLSGAGDALAGGPMVGNGDISFAGQGDMSLTVSLNADGTITVSGSGNLALTIGLAGGGEIAISGNGGLSMIVPFEGFGAFGLSGAGDLKGNLGLSGSWGGGEALSPQALASAVWGWADTVTPGSKGDELAKALKAAKLAAALSA